MWRVDESGTGHNKRIGASTLAGGHATTSGRQGEGTRNGCRRQLVSRAFLARLAI